MRAFKLENAVVVIESIEIYHEKFPLGIRLGVEDNPEVEYEELHAYPKSAAGNRDYHYSLFNQKKAEQFFERAKKQVGKKLLPKGFRNE